MSRRRAVGAAAAGCASLGAGGAIWPAKLDYLCRNIVVRNGT
ncbi:MAG: twin-arginine translocation signal domain-containing protein [Xanthobacteraceae bacterium]